jgi:hypothetical protein
VQVSGPSEREFDGGVHAVVYSTSALDLGEPPECRFTVSVLRGFNYVATIINHKSFAASATVHDYVMEQFPGVSGQLAAPSFTISGDIAAADFAIGIRSPAKHPFSLRVARGTETRIKVDMTWCSSGASLAGRPFQAVAARVELSGAPLEFLDQGSGMACGAGWRAMAGSDGWA